MPRNGKPKLEIIEEKPKLEIKSEPILPEILKRDSSNSQNYLKLSENSQNTSKNTEYETKPSSSNMINREDVIKEYRKIKEEFEELKKESIQYEISEIEKELTVTKKELKVYYEKKQKNKKNLSKRSTVKVKTKRKTVKK